MQKFIALALVTLGITVSARAQWIVYDPANTVQSVINTAQEIAKFVEMISCHVFARDDVKQQYWLYVSMQHQRNQVSSVRLYPVQVPKQRIDGVTFQPSTKLVRIEE